MCISPYSHQDVIYKKDIDSIITALNQRGVIQGLEVEPTSPASMAVSVSKGRGLFEDSTIEAGGEIVNISAADPTYDRKDLILVDRSGNISVAEGEPASSPKPPMYECTIWDDCEDLYNGGAAWTAVNDATVANTTAAKYGTNAIVIKGGTTDNPGASISFDYDGLVLYLPFEEGAGTIAHDESPYGNDGTIYGASWDDGKYGKALEFDGVDDRVGFGTFNPSGVLNTFPLTIAAWIYYYPDSGATYTYISNYVGSYTGWFLQKTVSNTFLIAVGTGSAFVTSRKGITSEGWIHAVAVIKGVGDTVTLYVDGQPQTPAATLTAYSNGNNTINIGGHPGSGGAKGIIDEVRIYNRALSEEEIKALYLAGEGSHLAKDWRVYKTLEIWAAPNNDDGTPATGKTCRVTIRSSPDNYVYYDFTLSGSDSYVLKRCQLNSSGVGDAPSGSVGTIDWSAISSVQVEIHTNVDNVDMAFDQIKLCRDDRIIIGQVLVRSGASSIGSSDIRDERKMIYGNKYKSNLYQVNRDDGSCKIFEDEGSLNDEDWVEVGNPMKQWGG